MYCNGLLWIYPNPVNGFEDVSMDFCGMFQKCRPDPEEYLTYTHKNRFLAIYSYTTMQNT